MTRHPTCQDCICCSSLTIRYELCKRLRATGACLVQNSQRVIVVVAPEAAFRDVRALIRGGVIWERSEAERR